MTAGSAAVSKDSPPVFNNILAYKDEVVPWVRKMTDALHEHGCAAMIQLTHLGRRTHWNKGDWLPAVTSTRHREPAHHAFPKLAEDWDIERIIGDFADAAERMKEGGMDGVEIMTHGHLLDQFISPLTNDLDGPYGRETLQNRMRLTTDIIAAVRARVGDEFVIGVRFAPDEAHDGGITPEMGVEIAKILKGTGQVDFLNVNRGRIHTDPAMTDMIPVQGDEKRAASGFRGVRSRRHGDADVSCVENSRSGDGASCDTGGAARYGGDDAGAYGGPVCCDQVDRGGERRIFAPCVGATYCLDRIYQAGEALCIHNPATGRELSMPHIIAPAKTRKKVVVVGGPGRGGSGSGAGGGRTRA